MFDSPLSLQALAINYIASSLPKICTVCEVATGYGANERILVFGDSNFVGHKYIAGRLLEAIDERRLLDDLVITLFDPRILPLTSFEVNNGSNITTAGLQVLQHHQLKTMSIRGLQNTSINQVLACMGQWNKNNLKQLCIDGKVFSMYSSQSEEDVPARTSFLAGFPVRLKFSFWKSGCSGQRSLPDSGNEAAAFLEGGTSKLLSLSGSKLGLYKFPHLKALDVSNTNITSLDLTTICNDLKHLAHLNLSSCYKLDSVDCLKDLKDTLTHLNLHDVGVLNKEDTKTSLLVLKKLVFLDLSMIFRELINPPMNNIVPQLLWRHNFVPKIQGIDLSGQMTITIDDLINFSVLRPNIRFLGLMDTPLCMAKFVLARTDWVVTGVANQAQLVECFMRYSSRKEYVPTFLYEIFSITSTYNTARPQLIKLILSVMNEHPLTLAIQLAGTACLYNLTKAYIGDGVHPHILRAAVQATLTAMKNFPEHGQLQKNSLLTLCCDRILHEVNFDKFMCARLVLDALLTFQDNATDRMAVAICSILAANLSTSLLAVLGASSAYMQKFLTLVKRKMNDGVLDITLKFTLSALWNLTDESPSTCEVFLKEKGLELFLKLMETFPGAATVEMKVLGLLNNIAEVSRLRGALINKNFITRLSCLLKSEQVEVCYSASGIIAQLVCAGAECWRDSGISRDDLLQELGQAVLSWTSPEEEMVAYRSFQPFIPLLMALDKPQAQLWAVWALHHVVTQNRTRYCRMLIREGVDDVLRRLIEVQNPDRNVVELARKILSVLPESETPTKLQRPL